MSDDARAELVRAAHATLGTLGVRFRETMWSDPLVEGVTDADRRVDGEMDLRSGWWRFSIDHPSGGGHNKLVHDLDARVAAEPLRRRPVFWAARGVMRMIMRPAESIGHGIEHYHRVDDRWVGPIERLVEPGPLHAVETLVRADDAQVEDVDEHGRRVRWRALDGADAPRPPLLPASSIVEWGWAWIDVEGRVRRVQHTRRALRERTRHEHAGWTLLELVEIDVDVHVEPPKDAAPLG